MPTADQFNQRGQTNLPGLLGIVILDAAPAAIQAELAVRLS
jgi:hypothetical protein